MHFTPDNFISWIDSQDPQIVQELICKIMHAPSRQVKRLWEVGGGLIQTCRLLGEDGYYIWFPIESGFICELLCQISQYTFKNTVLKRHRELSHFWGYVWYWEDTAIHNEWERIRQIQERLMKIRDELATRV
jgi:hypothetical protein